MVRVTKVAAWKIGDKFVEDVAEATKLIRRMVIEEILNEAYGSKDAFDVKEIAEFLSSNFDKIEARVKAAMTGA